MGQKMADVYRNFITAKIAESLSDTATSMTVQTMPALNLQAGESILMTLQKSDHSAHEIVRVSTQIANVLTIERAQDGTTAQHWNVGDELVAGVYAGQLAQYAHKNEDWYVTTTGAIDIQNGRHQIFTLTENATVSFDMQDGDSMTLILNSSPFAVTLPTVDKWLGGTFVYAANREYVIVVFKANGTLRAGWEVVV